MSQLKLPDCLPKDSWFRGWVEAWPTSESPKSFILFTAMTFLGACLGRKVWIDQDVHTVRPMLNLLLIGPSGIGKNSAVDLTRKLLPFVPEWLRPQMIEGAATKEKLHRDLQPNPKAIVLAEELAAFFSKEKYKENLIPYVTNLLDYAPAIELRTVKDNVIRVENPSVTIMGGSTLEWLQEQLPDSAVTGGFLARFLIVNEQRKGQKIANPHRFLGARKMKEVLALRDELYAEFPKLLAAHSGAMDYADYDAADTYAAWYNQYEPETGYLAPFAARAGEMILRMAMLLAISCKTAGITQEHIESAITLYEYIASRLGTIMVPTSIQGRLANMVLTSLPPEGLTMEELAQSLRTQAVNTDLDKLIDSLFFAGSVQFSGDKIVPAA